MKPQRRATLLFLLAGLLTLMVIAVLAPLLLMRQSSAPPAQERRGPAPTLAAVSSEEREQAAATLVALVDEMQKREPAVLAVAPSDLEEHAGFLRQPDTGIFRLLPWDFAPSLQNTSGGGVFFSFACGTHDYGNRTSMGLQQENFTALLYGRDLGIFADLGDVDLAALSPDDPQVLPLIEIASAEQPVDQRLDDLARSRRGSAFSERIPVRVGTTYLLRSINSSPYPSDVLTAFRVVRRDRDDSLIILWKLLRRFPLLPEDTQEYNYPCP